MILNALIGDQIYQLEVPEPLLEEAQDFFARMDEDMDQGIQMSRDWVAQPSLEQRCQWVANRLLTALENENHKLGRLMAGYILKRLPHLDQIEIDTSGEIGATQFSYRPLADEALDPAVLALAEERVSQPFKVGKQWRLSIHDRVADQWRNSPAIAREEDAQSLRQQAIERIYRELARGEKG
jgi:hypothetical protein